MDIEVRPCATHEELRDALNAIGHYFGYANELEDAERFAQWMEIERMHAAFDGDRAVGGAGAFGYRMSVPGGRSVPAAGTTVVAVLPTHPPRGGLRALMRAQLDDPPPRGGGAGFPWGPGGTNSPRFGLRAPPRVGA